MNAQAIPTAADNLKRRYGSDAAAAEVVLNAVTSVMLSHKSVRAYADEPLPEGVLPTLVAAAQSASTSSNLQAWSVIHVTDPAKRARLAELCNGQAHVEKAPIFLVWLADLARLRDAGGRAEAPTGGLDYLETFLVGVIDAALAAQNAATAAESMGLGVVYIGAMRNHPEAVAEVLGLPPLVFPVFGMCIGRPKVPSRTTVKPRLPQGVVLHHDTYDLHGQHAPIAAYDQTLLDFQTEQGMKPDGWSKQATTRVAGPQSLSGRDRLKEALANLGFRLE